MAYGLEAALCPNGTMYPGFHFSNKAPKVTLAYVELTCQNYGENLKFKNICLQPICHGASLPK